MEQKAGEWQVCGLPWPWRGDCLCCVLAARSPVRLCLIDIRRPAGQVGALDGPGWAGPRRGSFCLGLSVTGESLSVVARNPSV